ncbi:hypothetical protein COV93_03910 [Candidatus Woesearchaeota archaeon CG11_big_fil_rev_8_21_14_0_20_43_8]|nr:MAG: hypothetical protein COV93_03910 [Candidatus Woesearchaeota archaeon CG11_big_fil_rev_8_21_14_0_20_43_8]
MVLSDFLVPFIAIMLAELGDKTQLVVLCLASKTKKYLHLLLGVISAFMIADGLAIVFGNMITKHIPVNNIKIITGVIFIIFGIVMLIKKDEEPTKCDLKKPFLSGFLLILVSEMGDKTQITSGLFATQFNPYIVFFGVISALILLSVAAIYLGKHLLRKLDPKLTSSIAGALFILIGLFCFIQVIY